MKAFTTPMSVLAALTVTGGLLGGVAVAAPTSAATADTSAARLANGNSVDGVPYAGAGTDLVVDVDSRRTLDIDCGQTVLFRQGERSFAWKFDVTGHRAVDLARIAPAGFLSPQAAPFTVYVTENDGERN